MNRNNLEWLGRATNWAKFTATASLGVIHKVGLIHVYQIFINDPVNLNAMEIKSIISITYN